MKAKIKVEAEYDGSEEEAEHILRKIGVGKHKECDHLRWRIKPNVQWRISHGKEK